MDKKLQAAAFRALINLARRHNLPLVLHVRDVQEVLMVARLSKTVTES